jgi:hypothetical protein
MNRGEDGLVTMLAIATMAVMGWNAIADGNRAEPLPASAHQISVEDLDDNITVIAEAIAEAEGYFVEGDHDGRSLLHRLNNPGGLKKPALGAEGLPTWMDTGLIIFPTEAMGWAALRHQVGMMLTGKSEIYHPSDTLTTVGLKYADGDANWGENVATNLGVSPDAKLMELAEAIVVP